MSTSKKALLYTVAAISAILGTELFQYRETRGGGVQCNLNLPNVKTGGAQVKALAEARAKLEEAGYVIEDSAVQLAIPPRAGSGEKRWGSWPCIYVNPPRTDGGAVTTVRDTIAVVKTVMNLEFGQAKNILTALKNQEALELLESLQGVDPATRESILAAYTVKEEAPVAPSAPEQTQSEPLI